MDPLTIVAMMAGLAKILSEGKTLYGQLGKFIDDSVEQADVEMMTIKQVVERMKALGKLPSNYQVPK